MKAIALALLFALFAPAAELPRKAGDIEITLPDGTKLNPAVAYKGKVICLAFILTT